MASTSRLRVEPATANLVLGLRGRIRKSDADEVWASSHVTADEAVLKGFFVSRNVWVVLWDDVPALIFGVAPVSCLSTEGAPWMLATDLIYEMPVTFLRGSKTYLDIMLKGYNLLRNWVDQRNTLSVQWLTWLGFTVEEAEPFGLGGQPFHYFWMKGDQPCVPSRQSSQPHRS